MDVTSIAALGTAMSQTGIAQQAAISVFKKALDMQEQSAMQLLQAIPQANNPAHLGNGVDVRA